jgi:hypothetical protein
MNGTGQKKKGRRRSSMMNFKRRPTIMRKNQRKEAKVLERKMLQEKDALIAEKLVFVWYDHHSDDNIYDKDWQNLHLAKTVWRPRPTWPAWLGMLVLISGAVCASGGFIDFAFSNMLRVMILANSGFVYVNYCTTCRPSLFRGRHRGCRDIVLLNLYVVLFGMEYPAGVDCACGPRLPPPDHWKQWAVFSICYIIGLQFSFFVRWLHKAAQREAQAKDAKEMDRRVTADRHLHPTPSSGGRMRWNSFHRRTITDAGETEEFLGTCCNPLGPMIAKALRHCLGVKSQRALLIGTAQFLFLVTVGLTSWEMHHLWSHRCYESAVHLSALIMGVFSFGWLTHVLMRSSRKLRWHLHLHHYFFSGILLPFFLCTSGSSFWRWGALSCAGICMGVMVEGSTRWSFAPLWYGELRVQDEAAPPPEVSPQLREPRFSANDFGALSIESATSMDSSMDSVIEEGEDEDEDEEDEEDEKEKEKQKQKQQRRQQDQTCGQAATGTASKLFAASTNTHTNPLMNGKNLPLAEEQRQVAKTKMTISL